MKTAFLPVVLLCMMFVLFPSCNQKKERTCSLIAASIEGPLEPMTITFKATQTGDGKIESLTYKTSSGIVTVPNPGLPWTITADALANTEVSIIAVGTVKTGSLTISYEGKSTGNEISGSDFCSQE